MRAAEHHRPRESAPRAATDSRRHVETLVGLGYRFSK
jgi:hypothetical protein